MGGFLEIFGLPGVLFLAKGWAPWAFSKGDTKKIIAVGVRLWVPDEQYKQISRVAIQGYTDN